MTEDLRSKHYAALQMAVYRLRMLPSGADTKRQALLRDVEEILDLLWAMEEDKNEN